MPSPVRPAAALLAAAALGMGLSACSVRLETPPVITPTPSQDTVLRDAAADAEQAVIDAVAEDGANCDNFAGEGTAALAAELGPVRLAALGGVYVAFPSASPAPSLAVTPTACIATIVDAIDTDVDGAIAAEDESLAALLGSIAISHALAVTLVGDDPGWTLDAGEAADALDPASAAELAVMHDAARFAYETLAATVGGEERELLLARRDAQATAVDGLLDTQGVADLRESLYVVDVDADPTTLVTQTEQAIGAAYLDAFSSSAAERSPSLLVASATYLRAGLDASGSEVPALPGLEAGASGGSTAADG